MIQRMLPPAFLILVVLAILIGSASAGTYYIATNGSDSNSGTSQTSAWAHLPGMATCVGNCSAHAPAAGDVFILRGCDDWGNSNFPIKWSWAGASGNPIAIGVNKSWYNASACPSGWNRPIFDGGGTMIAGTGEFFHGATGISYISLDSIEARNFFWNTNNGGNLLSMFCFGNCASGTHGITVTNFYVHAWKHTALGSGGDVCTVFQGASTSPYSADFDFENNVIDGTDSTNGGDSCRTFEFIGGKIKFNIVKGASNGIRPSGGGEIAFNNLSISSSFDSTIHENAIESQVSNQTFYIHDNYVHDMAAGEGLQVCGPGETDYVWNNIWSLSGGGNPPAVPRNDGVAVACTAFKLWNNTIVPQANVNCIHHTGAAGSTIGTLNVQNNDCISSGGMNDSFSGVASAQAISSNVVRTPSVASSQGYSTSEAFVYSPPASCTPTSCSTIQAGTNLAASWPTGFSTNDTGYSCTEQTINGVVTSSCPARTAVTRGSGNWDAGAYYFGSASAGPVPPTGLTATVQ